MAEYIERGAALSLVRPDAPEDEKAAVTIATAKKLVRSIVFRTPAADVAPVVHWVLTDEKLPPDGQDVLCWYEYFRFGAFNRMYQTFGVGYQFNGNWGGEVVQGQKAKVLAWMPLPKPPKMEGDENGRTDG